MSKPIKKCETHGTRKSRDDQHCAWWKADSLSPHKSEPRWYEPWRLPLTPATWKFHPMKSDTQEQPENELPAAATVLWQLCLASSAAFPQRESIELEDTGFNGNKHPCHAVWGWVFAKGTSVLLFSSTAPSKGTPANLLILIIIILCGNNKTRLCSPCYFLWFGIFPLIKLEALKASIERMRSVHLMYYLIGLQQISLYSVSALNKCLFKGCTLCLFHTLNCTCFTARLRYFLSFFWDISLFLSQEDFLLPRRQLDVFIFWPVNCRFTLFPTPRQCSVQLGPL